MLTRWESDLVEWVRVSASRLLHRLHTFRRKEWGYGAAICWWFTYVTALPGVSKGTGGGKFTHLHCR